MNNHVHSHEQKNIFIQETTSYKMLNKFQGMLQSSSTVKQPEQNRPFNSPFSCSMLLYKNKVLWYEVNFCWENF